MADGKTLKEAAAEKLAHSINVNGIVIEGVTEETLGDFEFLEAIAVMSDPESEDGERLRAMAKIGPVTFGSKQWTRIKAELREQNDGKLPAEAVMEFVNAVIEAVKAKNS